MLLYILRHADAETEAPTDDERPLSRKGFEQADRVARFCRKNEIRPALVLTSPLPRARQTAEPVARELQTELLVAPWLASGMTPQTAVEALKEYRSRTSVIITG